VNLKYQNLEVWKLAYAFVLKIYGVVEKFPAIEDNNLTSQLRRATTCLPLNIAEGSGARSPKIFLTYLVFAYRSSKEIETCLMLARDLKYLSLEEFDNLWNDLNKFEGKLYSYMEYLEKDVGERKRDLTFHYRQKREVIKEDLSKFA
jgi:four helix bundle protein